MKPSVEITSDHTSWMMNNYHCEDGPAIEFANGSKEWWLNGKRHREDGPAIEYENGDKYWYYDGKNPPRRWSCD